MHSKLVSVVESVARRDLPTDRPWREAVDKRLEDLGMTQTELATWVGTVQSQISYMLHEETPLGRSAFVERVSVALGVPLPNVARVELALKALAENEDQAAIAGIASNAELIAARSASNPAPPAPTTTSSPERTKRRRTRPRP